MSGRNSIVITLPLPTVSSEYRVLILKMEKLIIRIPCDEDMLY